MLYKQKGVTMPPTFKTRFLILACFKIHNSKVVGKGGTQINRWSQLIGYAFFVIAVQKVIAQTPPLGCKTVPIFSLYQYQRQYSHCCLTNSKGNELIRPTTILPSISKSHILYLQQKETKKRITIYRLYSRISKKRANTHMSGSYSP